MPFQRQIDLLNRACIGFFGDDDVTFSPLGIPAYTVKGIYDNEFEIVDPETQAAVVSTQPVVHLKTSSLKHQIQEEELLVVDGVNYRVYELNSDNKGMVVVFLKEVEIA